ncbi:MAG: UvrD-helicase domain-containing protein [Gordonia sp. (in: high G+C Gram-positive bacteria)]|uniref:UvrD-helicase domain-containing protein n=1 Tax=Gordonia sp. (in: high G+C Gram-positive bacteria) TaxID=84139 RepID=UPI0039E302AF
MTDVRDGLDPQQLEAVLAPRGPVCVLAGAGTGKTRTITRRIAALIDSGQVNPGQVLAVTFTSKAAAEMRQRLEALGIAGPGNRIAAQTFHAAALRQLRYFWPMVYGGGPWELMDSKFPMVRRAARDVGLDTADRELIRDLASEIEWAKSTGVGAGDYAQACLGRDLPVAAGTVAEVFAAYEDGKSGGASGVRLLDFEDLIIFTTTALLGDPAIAEEFRSRYRSFVVDEYQDVTPIQQDLLQAWLGARDDLTVVGDANQTIYSFTGATPNYLLDFTRRYPDATLVRLVRDYRSTPQVVGLANGVIGKATSRVAGTRLALVGQRPDGPEPEFTEYPDADAEVVGVVARIKKLLRAGVPADEIAVLYRVNAQSEGFEEALAAAGVEYRVRGDRAFFDRPEIIAALRRLRELAAGPPPPMGAAEAVRRALVPIGLTDTPPDGAHARARWEQLTRLAELADGVVADHPEAAFADVVRILGDRARSGHDGSQGGVTLASLHAAKGLEWDAVLLTGLNDGSVPLTRAGRSAEEIEEERRLLYVGITRARTHLHLSWSLARSEGRPANRRRSRFLDGLVPTGAPKADAPRTAPDRMVLDALKTWRDGYAANAGIAKPNVCSSWLLEKLATQLPTSTEELRKIGMLPDAVDVIGPAVLDVIETAGRK